MRCAWSAGLLVIIFICCFGCMCRRVVLCCLLAVGTSHFKRAPSISAAKAVIKPRPLKPTPTLLGPVLRAPGRSVGELVCGSLLALMLRLLASLPAARIPPQPPIRAPPPPSAHPLPARLSRPCPGKMRPGARGPALENRRGPGGPVLGSAPLGQPRLLWFIIAPVQTPHTHHCGARGPFFIYSGGEVYLCD